MYSTAQFQSADALALNGHSVNATLRACDSHWLFDYAGGIARKYYH